jgi:hypothetical protein
MNFPLARLFRRMFRITFLGLFALGFGSASAQQLTNGDFEGAFQQLVMPAGSKSQIDGSVATGWRDESAWGQVSIAYSKDPTGGHNGTSAQKIEVRSITQGAVQFVQELPFKPSTTYRLTAWVKAAAPGQAALMLRQSGTPYATYGNTNINLTTEWAQVQVTGTATAGDNGLVMFLPSNPGTYWIDDVVLQDVAGAASAPAAGPLLQNPGMEGTYVPVTPPSSPLAKIDGMVAPGWLDESGWGEVSIGYSQDQTVKHGGTSAQKIEVRSIGKGAALFIQKVPLQNGRIYRATAWMKAAAPGQASLYLRESGAPYSTYSETKAQLTTEWTQVELPMRVTNTELDDLAFTFPEPGTFWIDDVTLEDVTDGVKPSASAGGAVPIPLINADFEGKFQPYVKSPSAKAQISGDVAEGWEDNSDWADVAVVYGRDDTIANGGKTSQRIDVKAIKSGAIQFQQELPLKAGRIYRFTSYVRAAINTQAMIQIRQKGPPYEVFGQLEAAISPEWRKFEVYARMDKDADGLLLFSPSEPTTYWVDDVKLEDVTDLGSAGTAQKGNLFSNGSFEAGPSEGWLWWINGFDDGVKTATREHLDRKATVDTTTAADGTASLKVTLGPWSAGLFSSPTVPAKFGQTYTGSIAIKSDRPGTAEISLGGTTGIKEVTVGPEWKRFSVSGSAVLGPTVQLLARCIVRDTTSPVQFWLDAAMLEEGSTASPAYLAPYPVELALTMDRPGSIVFDGEAAPLKLSTGGNLPPGAVLKWSVENLAGQVTDLPKMALPATSLTIPPDTNSPRGVFKIHAQVVDKDGKPLSSEIQKIFARLPHPRDLTPEQALNSYFGAHVELTPEKLAVARATGNRWVRLHDTSSVTRWQNVEAVPGTWAWNDEGIKAAHQAGLNILGLLAGAPNRETLHPQAQSGYFAGWNVPDAPDALDHWAEYVKQTVAHYQPLISYWEVWNEPYINGATSAFFPNGTPEQYGELLKRASPVIRATNPKAFIVGVCGPGADSAWLDRALKVAGPEYFDAMSFHAYGGRLQGGEKPEIERDADQLRADEALFGTPKPLWESEGGPTDEISWYVNQAPAMHFQMSSLVRLDVCLIAGGVKKFFIYTMGNSGDYGAGGLSLMEYDRSIKPALAARAVLASLIDGATYGGRTEPQPGVDSHSFTQSDGSHVQVLWSFDAKPHSLDIPAGMQALDVLGNPLTGPTVSVGEEPLYFTGK